MRWRTWTAAGAALAVALAGLWWMVRAPAAEVETAAITWGAFEETVEDDGRARVRERTAVTMPWAGELERPVLKEGMWVAPEEVLFWVRPIRPPLQDGRTKAELLARGASAQAAWQHAARQVEVAQVAWQRAALSASRTAALADEGFVSRAQVEAALLDLRREDRSWQAAREAERVALHELEQVTVLREMPSVGARAGDARLAVRAATRVQVLRVVQPHGAVLPAGAAVLEVGDVRRPEVVVPLLSQDALRVAPGSMARLSGWASVGGRAVVMGRVRLVEPAAATKVSALGLEEQRVNVVVDPEGPLPDGDGYTVRVQVVLRESPKVKLAPASAVFPWPGEPARQAVFVVRDGHARRVPVTVEGRGATGVWIGQGLEAGEEVIVYPPASLSDGTRVRVVRRS